MRVSEIRVKRIRVNQGLGVISFRHFQARMVYYKYIVPYNLSSFDANGHGMIFSFLN